MKRTPLARRSKFKPQRKRMKPVSDKRRKHRASPEGKAGLAWMGRVKGLHCVVCGSPPPNDAHHCMTMPPENERHHYNRLPAGGRKSGDKDTIPLCRLCHTDGPDAYHRGKEAWAKRNGPDYGFLPLVRALLDEHDTIDF